jgi:hypothetical protein
VFSGAPLTPERRSKVSTCLSGHLRGVQRCAQNPKTGATRPCGPRCAPAEPEHAHPFPPRPSPRRSHHARTGCSRANGLFTRERAVHARTGCSRVNGLFTLARCRPFGYILFEGFVTPMCHAGHHPRGVGGLGSQTTISPPGRGRNLFTQPNPSCSCHFWRYLAEGRVGSHLAEREIRTFRHFLSLLRTFRHPNMFQTCSKHV